LRLSLAILLLAAAPARAQDMHPIELPSPSWMLTLGGYVHVAYRWIQQPSNYNLAGKNNGFQLEQARVGFNVQYKDKMAIRVSFEGASEDRVNQSFPGGTLTARLRDAYITYAPWRFLRVSIGQMVTPWDLDSMRSDAWLPFVSRAVPVEGVQPSEGRATLGMGQDRNLGLALHSGDITFASNRLSIRYEIFVGNGNGQNQILNSNNKPAIFGRAELAVWGAAGPPPDQISPIRARTDGHGPLPYFGLGVAAQWNPRTGGNPPNLIDETDSGAAVDVIAAFYGVDLEAGLLYLRTKYETLSATPDLERFGWWAHARYTIPKIPTELTLGYRIGSYSPRAHLSTTAAPGSAAIDGSFDLLYHTIGLAIRPTRTFPLHFELNYTFTRETTPNILDNDRFEADAVAVF
jgi:hypothetical protein